MRGSWNGPLPPPPLAALCTAIMQRNRDWSDRCCGPALSSAQQVAGAMQWSEEACNGFGSFDQARGSRRGIQSIINRLPPGHQVRAVWVPRAAIITVALEAHVKKKSLQRNDKGTPVPISLNFNSYTYLKVTVRSKIFVRVKTFFNRSNLEISISKKIFLRFKVTEFHVTPLFSSHKTS